MILVVIFTLIDIIPTVAYGIIILSCFVALIVVYSKISSTERKTFEKVLLACSFVPYIVAMSIYNRYAIFFNKRGVYEDSKVFKEFIITFFKEGLPAFVLLCIICLGYQVGYFIRLIVRVIKDRKNRKRLMR